jgi:hypothetical protein
MKHIMPLALMLIGCASAPKTLTGVLDAPVWTIEKRYGLGASERCYEAANGRFVILSVDSEDPRRFWRVMVSDVRLCEPWAIHQPQMPSTFEVPFDLGDTSDKVISSMGEPSSKGADERSANSWPELTKLGGEVWTYECSAPSDCGWLTRVFFRERRVSAIEMSYSP